MKYVTTKGIETYIRSNYGELRHDAESMKVASRKVAKQLGFRPIDVFKFMIEDQPIRMSHSYGFHTRYGREVHRMFEYEYQRHKAKNK